MIPTAKTWYVYIVSCRDRTLYTGITTDPERRLHEHNSTKNGAGYTRGRRPVSLVYVEGCPSRSAASRREHCIKKMSRSRKNQLACRQQAHQVPAAISDRPSVPGWKSPVDDVD